MSYILDALRKSEQERMRGKLPDLNHFGEEDKRGTSAHRWMWVLGGAVLTLNVIAVGIWLLRSEPAPAPVVVSSETSKESSPASDAAKKPVSVADPLPVADNRQQTSVVPGAQSAEINAQPAPALANSVPPTTQTVTPSVPVQAGTSVPAAAVTAVPAGSAPPGTVYYVTPGTPVPGQQIVVVPAGSVVPGTVAPAGNVVVQMPTQAAAAWPAPNAAVQPPPPVPPPPTPVNLDQALDASGAGAATPNVSYLPQLDELPEYLRAQIPDMTFSSHMYSSMPRFRSVVINGTRVKEGQMVANNIQVNEITETGVILSVGGTVFQVDVLGKWSQ